MNNNTDSFQNRIEKLNNLISNSHKIIFFGGAGVSTDSGIPDFRSKTGLYNTPNIGFEKYQPEYLLSHDCLVNNPDVFFEFYRQKLDVRNVEPNTTHKVLADMEAKEKLFAVITQNIDGLHQKAGSKNVLEIHGTTQRVYCPKCGKAFDSNFILDCEGVPSCPCGGNPRPAVTLYGETLPEEFYLAIRELKSADLFIVGGTSLTVYPANTLLSHFYGENLVIINQQKTEYDQYADILFHESLSDVFEQIKY